MKKIYLNDEKILIKNKKIFLKKNFYCNTIIPLNIEVLFYKNIIFVKSLINEINKEKSFYKKILNLLIGINNFWKINVFISGIGYKIYIIKNNFFLNLGFSKEKKIKIPKKIFLDIKKDKITIQSSYKDEIGIFAYKLLKLKKFDPYKKKGIFIENKFFIKKSSKKKQ